jgi:hypothetical protein
MCTPRGSPPGCFSADSPDSNPAEGKFRGGVEEVDTNREIKFHSLEEFLAFLQNRIENSSDGG